MASICYRQVLPETSTVKINAIQSIYMKELSSLIPHIYNIATMTLVSSEISGHLVFVSYFASQKKKFHNYFFDAFCVKYNILDRYQVPTTAIIQE